MTPVGEQEEADAVPLVTQGIGSKSSSQRRRQDREPRGDNFPSARVPSPSDEAQGTGRSPTSRAAARVADRTVGEIFSDLGLPSEQENQTRAPKRSAGPGVRPVASIHGPCRSTTSSDSTMEEDTSVTEAKRVSRCSNGQAGNHWMHLPAKREEREQRRGEEEDPAQETEETEPKEAWDERSENPSLSSWSPSQDLPPLSRLASPREGAAAHSLNVTQEEQLNFLLLKISKALDPGDFEDLKFLCSGKCGVPTSVLERLTKPQTLFMHLKDQGIISPHNLLRLQSYLWHMDRRDLQEEVAEYAKRLSDTLYFFSPKREPGDNTEHVTFHVAGTLDDFSRQDLEQLRHSVSRLMMVPEEHVTVSGIEPSNSILLIFTVPREGGRSPIHYLRNGTQELTKLRVDWIMARGETFNFHDPTSSTHRHPKNQLAHLEDSLFHKSRNIEEAAPQEPEKTSRKGRDEALVTMYHHYRHLERVAEKSQLRAIDTAEKLQAAEERVVAIRRAEEFFRLTLALLAEAERGREPLPFPGKVIRHHGDGVGEEEDDYDIWLSNRRDV